MLHHCARLVGRCVRAVVRAWGARLAPAPAQRRLTPCGGWRRDVWPGLVRWSLRQQRTNAGWRVYVHRFSVTDSEVHNHPWAWSVSFLVAGEYTEWYIDALPGADPTGPRPAGPLRPRRVRWWNRIPVTRYHAVTDFGSGRTEGRVWTVFVCGPAIVAEHRGGQ